MKAIFFLIATFAASTALSGGGDAQIKYNLGLAAQKQGDVDRAYKLFKAACMDSDPVVDACMAWGRLAEQRENKKDVKRAYGSAVMLAPEDIEARFELAVGLIKKKDWVWAIEHLTEAVEYAKDKQDKALLRYYLGYALYKNKQLDEASKQLSLSKRDLQEELKPRCDYYRALTAKAQGNEAKYLYLLKDVSKTKQDPWAKASKSNYNAQSAFSWRDGFAGQVRASFGVNTRPSSDSLDETGDKNPVLQSVFRYDQTYSIGNLSDRFYAAFIAYREQNWLDLKEKKSDIAKAENGRRLDIIPSDFNTSILMLQPAYLHRALSINLEHEIKIGFDGDLQFLDHQPEEIIDGFDFDSYGGMSIPGDRIRMFGNSFAGKIWWSMAPNRDTVWSLRLKAGKYNVYRWENHRTLADGDSPKIKEERKRYLNDNTTMRLRLRISGTRNLLGRSLRLGFIAGVRYDRATEDETVIKYDRLLPHLELKSRWRTPIKRLNVLVEAKIKHNWYMNSTGDRKNSFRATWYPADTNPQVDADLEQQYYDELARADFEWETYCEVQFALWPKAMAVASYKHRGRHSTINLETPMAPIALNDEVNPPPNYSYQQDVVMLELRQGF